MEEAQEIGDEAIRLYTDKFMKIGMDGEYPMIDNSPKLITEEQGIDMDKTLTIDEVKDAVFSLNKDSVSGLMVF